MTRISNVGSLVSACCILHGVKGEAWVKIVTIVKMLRTSQQGSAQLDRQPITPDLQHTQMLPKHGRLSKFSVPEYFVGAEHRPVYSLSTETGKVTHQHLYSSSCKRQVSSELFLLSVSSLAFTLVETDYGVIK